VNKAKEAIIIAATIKSFAFLEKGGNGWK